MSWEGLLAPLPESATRMSILQWFRLAPYKILRRARPFIYMMEEVAP